MNEAFKDLILHSDNFVIGKADVIMLALTAILAKGHLLIEDIPGVGKTTMVKYLGKILGLNLGRIQCTNDLLPSDILGVHIFDEQKGQFIFKKGPIFNNLVLADELNRATPKTQSALLQVMEEYEITLDGETFVLPAPFYVIATQNPTEQVGTNPLPEGQIDRFLMGIHLNVPTHHDELRLLKSEKIQSKLDTITPLITLEQLSIHQKKAAEIFSSEPILKYILDILNYTRSSHNLRSLSPRAGLDILRAAKAYAYIQGRDHIIPEDVKHILPSVIGHRINKGSRSEVGVGEQLALEIIGKIEIV